MAAGLSTDFLRELHRLRLLVAAVAVAFDFVNPHVPVIDALTLACRGQGNAQGQVDVLLSGRLLDAHRPDIGQVRGEVSGGVVVRRMNGEALQFRHFGLEARAQGRVDLDSLLRPLGLTLRGRYGDEHLELAIHVLNVVVGRKRQLLRIQDVGAGRIHPRVALARVRRASAQDRERGARNENLNLPHDTSSQVRSGVASVHADATPVV